MSNIMLIIMANYSYTIRVAFATKVNRTLEFSLNVFTEFAEFSDKKNQKSKRDGTQDLLWKKQRLYNSATEPQATEQILILNPIHASVISQILLIP